MALRQRLQAGDLVLSTMISEVTSPNIAHMAKVAGLDSFIVDMEHGLFDYSSMASAVALGRALGLQPIVRVPEVRKEPIQKALDAGASGILAPLVRSAAAVQLAVSLSRYPPEGRRGVALKRAHGNYANAGVGPYSAQANADVAVLVQVETREALESIDEIAAIDGLDCLFIGPQDLSMAIGHVDAPWSDDMKAVFERVAGAATAAGKSWGMQTTTFEQASYAQQEGARYVSCSSDVVMLTDRLGEIPARIREGLS